MLSWRAFDRLAERPWPLGVLAGAVAVAAVTGAIELFRPWVPVLALGVLYLFAVLPIAVIWGRLFAIGVSIASMLCLNWFFLPPVHTFTLADRENWYALAVYLAVGVVVADLATRARERALEAAQREREASTLADISARFLSGRGVGESLDYLATRAGEVLGVERPRLELDRVHEPPRGESLYELRAGERLVGTLYAREGKEPNLSVRRRFLPSLASILAVAVDRERFASEAVEAESLRQSDSIKTAVLRAVSHDLRTPLTAMRVAVDALGAASLELSAEQRAELIGAMGAELSRLERLVADLLDLSRLQAGAAAPTPELWAVEDLVGRALDSLGAEADRVSVAIDGPVPPVHVDAAHVERVLANLIENAIRFAPPGAPVQVRARSTRRDVLIRVIDQGPGIDPSQADAIFEPFTQPADGRGRTGLGLAIARGFAEANGARISVESRPGQGATFTLSIPGEEVPAEIEA
jgi:two-component system, OmpR family, sensor histidine kinase KdpD